MVNGVICANGVNQYKPLPDDYTCLLFGVNIIIRNDMPEGTVSDRWDSVMKGTIKSVSKNWDRLHCSLMTLMAIDDANAPDGANNFNDANGANDLDDANNNQYQLITSN